MKETEDLQNFMNPKFCGFQFTRIHISELQRDKSLKETHKCLKSLMGEKNKNLQTRVILVEFSFNAVFTYCGISVVLQSTGRNVKEFPRFNSGPNNSTETLFS